MNTKADSSIIKEQLPSNAKMTLKDGLTYYKENLVEKDLRRSEYMTRFKRWITSMGKELGKVPIEFQEHVSVLRDVSKVYEEYFWPAHQNVCKQTLTDNIDMIKKTEDEFVENITKLTHQFWQFEPEKVRVDLTYFGKSNTRNFSINPYTTIFPTHVVLNTFGENKVEGNWLELLYHESAHHLILGRTYFVAGTIRDLCEVMGIEPPRQLSHAYLFFFTGYLTQKLLKKEGIEYPEIYMVRKGVFSRYYNSLENHLMSYINREITLTEATRRIIEDLEI